MSAALVFSKMAAMTT